MKRKKRRGKGGRVLAEILLGLLVLILIAALAVFLYVNGKLNKLNYDPAGTVTPPQYTEEERALLEADREDEGEQIESSGTAPEGDVFEDKDVINILLLGTDMRIPNTSDPGRADCTMIASFNRATGEIKLISFERGIMVPVPERGLDLLTNSYRWAGPDYTQSIFRDYFLLDVAGYAQVDFDAFVQIIDILGGVDLEISQDEAWAINKQFGTTLQEGKNHMDGKSALGYCRLRKIDSNWVRIVRQRNTVQAVIYKLKGSDLATLDQLANEILPLIHTNLTKAQIASLLVSAPKFLGVKAEQMTVPDRVPGMGAYCNFQSEAERLKQFIYGTED